MDWLRLLRALDAGHIEQVEERRAEKLAGRINDLSTDEWERIAEHDRWLDEID